jgi:hypothetical protein
MDNNNMNRQTPQNNNKATASLVLGIISLICICLAQGAFIGIILGVLGLIFGIQAKKEFPSNLATAGIVLSIIGLSLCAITFLACVACVACVGALGALTY